MPTKEGESGLEIPVDQVLDLTEETNEGDFHTPILIEQQVKEGPWC